MKCPKCGAESVEGLNFCKRCWTSFGASEPRPNAPSEGDTADDAHGRGPLFGVPYVSRTTDDAGELPWAALRDQALPAVPDHRESAERLRAEVDAGPSPRSVLSLILGMLSVVLFCLIYLTVPLDLAGFVLGMLELRDINRGAAPRAGRGFATAGVILSGCALVVKLFIFLLIKV